MTIDTTLAPHPVVAALERVEEAIAEARNVVWSLGDDDVVLALDLRERLAAQFDGLGLDLIAQADVRGVASQVGASSTAALLRDRLRIRPGDASARVRLAGDRQLEATRVALSAGDITLGHAKVIEHAVTRLPAGPRGRPGLPAAGGGDVRPAAASAAGPAYPARGGPGRGGAGGADRG
jgi:hypothetical protein